MSKLKSDLEEVRRDKDTAVATSRKLCKKYKKLKEREECTNERKIICKCCPNQKGFDTQRHASVETTEQEPTEEVLDTMQRQASKIKMLESSVENLVRAVQSKDEENRRLHGDRASSRDIIEQHRDVSKRLSETNAKLVSSLQAKHESFIAVKNKAAKIQKRMDEYRNAAQKSVLVSDFVGLM